VRRPTPRRLLHYVTKVLRLGRFLVQPGDGRLQPDIPARTLLWAILLCRLLRQTSFHAIEQLVRLSGCRALGVNRGFGDDALGYFTERLDPATTRAALVTTVRRAKRNKAFENSRFIGLAIDGTTAGRCRHEGCSLCRPFRNADKEISGYRHHFTAVSVVGAGLSLPLDVEPYGSGDSEYAAGQRLLGRAVRGLGTRFADYVVVDGEFATATFLHATDEAGLPVVARLKANLPELFAAVNKRFGQQPPTRVYRDGRDRVELWDAADFDPWETLSWPTVRVLRYRQHKPDGTVVDADWLTNLPLGKVGSLSLYHMAKSRWEIENQGFNDAKNRYGLDHICHHHTNSILLNWLLLCLALVIERLYRIRYLHRGNHTVLSALQLCRLLWLGLSSASALDTS
jgi:hypothetical protein